MRSCRPIALQGALAALFVSCGPEAPPGSPTTGAQPTGAQEGESSSASGVWHAAPATLGEECADCHPTIVAGYQQTGMARALGPVEAAEAAHLGPLDDAAMGYRYALEASDQGLAIVETRPGQAHRRELPLAFAVGAGEIDRSYVALNGADMTFAPLEVVRHGAVRATALAPPHAMQPGLRFDVAVTAECLGCHTDSPPPSTWPLSRAPAEGTWTPRGISCAACHGRTSEHVAWQLGDLTEGDPAQELPREDPILRPRELERIQRLSVCASCHLQGDARILLESRQLAPPPPGGDVLESRAVFVAREPTDEIGFVSQVERLLLSRCFLESEALVCESCHDPHHSLNEEEERLRVRAACSTCHSASGSGMGTGAHEVASPCPEPPRAGRDCVDCHMRRTPTFDVAGVEITDHFIRTSPAPPSRPGPLRFPESAEGDWRVFSWPGAPAPAYAEDPGLQMMALYLGGHYERAVALADEPLGGATAKLPMAHHVRGSLLEAMGRAEDAVRAYESALRLDPQLGSSVVNLGALHAKLGRPGEALSLLSGFLARHPHYDAALRNRAIVRHGLGDLPGFAEDLEEAFSLAPKAALAANLSAYYATLGQQADARAWAERAHELDPLQY